MRRFIISALVLSGMTANAQVKNGMIGINTDEPRATLHIEPGVSESKGLIIPRITAAQMKTMTNLAHFGADHHAIITYLKEPLPLADRTGKLVDVADPGYYYYDNTTGVQKWKAFGAEQDFKAIQGSYVGLYNYLSKSAGVGGNGASAGTGWGNIAIGHQAFYSNTEGYDNIAQGYGALYSNTKEHNNIAQGYQALYSNTEGYGNIAQGYQALYRGTGSDNIAQGHQALYGGTGSNNIAQGHQALYRGAGSDNIAQGLMALYQNTRSNNIAQGHRALFNNIAADGNIAQGHQALFNNTYGFNNIAQGGSALISNTLGSNNIVIGLSALSQNIAGKSNIALGEGSGSWIKGHLNVHIGKGSNQIFTASGELDRVIFIGHNNLYYPLTTATADNNVILLGDSAPNAPKIGMGTYQPKAKLDVNGGMRVGKEATCTSANEGTIIYDSTTKKFQGCDGTSWVNLN